MCMITCCFSRSVPWNYLLLFIFTVCESYMVAGATAQYEPDIVIGAGLTTALVTIALTVYAWTTRHAIEFFAALTFVIYLALFPLLIINVFFLHLKSLQMISLVLGLLFCSLFLIIDTMIICNTRKTVGGQSISYDDYVLGAIMLYVDILQIFVYLLRLFA